MRHKARNFYFPRKKCISGAFFRSFPQEKHFAFFLPRHLKGEKKREFRGLTVFSWAQRKKKNLAGKIAFLSPTNSHGLISDLHARDKFFFSPKKCIKKRASVKKVEKKESFLGGQKGKAGNARGNKFDENVFEQLGI